jgi:hypothetical protein
VPFERPSCVLQRVLCQNAFRRYVIPNCIRNRGGGCASPVFASFDGIWC